MNLIDKSIAVILNNQHPGGAFVASPDFAQYKYGWFRDGAYISYALDLYGYYQSTEKFFDWCVQIIERYKEKILRMVEEPSLVLGDNRVFTLHCRFTLEGEEINSGWSTHQLDGLGILLWAIVEHCKLQGLTRVPSKWQQSIDLIVRYCIALWRFPCADCWEENDDQIHTYTLAALAGGLQAYQEFSGANDFDQEIDLIKKYIAQHCISPQGFYKKSANQELVDASLMGLMFPFEIVHKDNPSFLKTLTMIESELHVTDGGVLRYSGDTYYGGGEWILLTAWLGSIHILYGDYEKALEIKYWIEQQTNIYGQLPEQVTGYVRNKELLQTWISKWGPPAVPLLWSHANYLVLCQQIQNLR